MWTYEQSTGKLSHDGQLVGMGYSGHEDGKNNPQLQGVANVGPIPVGEWTISQEAFNSPTHGPFCLRLTPGPETNTFGRSGFLIHGDSVVHPGLASEGCIIQLHATRLTIKESGDVNLTVV